MQTLVKHLFNGFSQFSSPGKDFPSPFFLEQKTFSEKGLDQLMHSSDYLICPDLIRYQIRNGRLHLHSIRSTRLNERTLSMTQALYKLCRRYRLPNTDFILTLHDAFTYVKTAPLPAPVFSFAKNRYTEPDVILLPDFEILRGYPSFYSPEKVPPWSKKKPMAVWRGGTTGGDYTKHPLSSFPRVQLIQFSQKHPRHLDARFNTHCLPQKIADELTALRYMGNTLSIGEQLQYKYQILIDGNSCAYSRTYWQLHSDALMLKIDSDNVQWYYEELKPYVHYVPIKSDLSDLVEKIEWAQAHDEEARGIVEKANAFAKKHLSQEIALSYLSSLLGAYAEKMVYEM